MKKITWDEMKKEYPDEWLLITDFDVDKCGHMLAGIVARHSKEKGDVYRLPPLNKPTAFRYTGESTFAGKKSYRTIVPGLIPASTIFIWSLW